MDRIEVFCVNKSVCTYSKVHVFILSLYFHIIHYGFSTRVVCPEHEDMLFPFSLSIFFSLALFPFETTKGASARKSSLDMEVLSVFIALGSRGLGRLVNTTDFLNANILLVCHVGKVNVHATHRIASPTLLSSSSSSFGPMLIDCRIPLQRCV